jgi:hypothetical protein
MGLAGLSLASRLCKIFINSFDTMGGRNSYIDVENSKIRSERRISCNYGINGFCSLKCENEYRYR